MDLVLCLKIFPLPLGDMNVFYTKIFLQICLEQSIPGARSYLLLTSCCSKEPEWPCNSFTMAKLLATHPWVFFN